jgi:hypothetical protein
MVEIYVQSDIVRLRNQAERMSHLHERLMPALRDAILDAAQTLPPKVRQATGRLPSTGGLAARVARTDIQIIARVFGDNVGAHVVARPNAVKDPDAIDRGRVRHPVYGRWTQRPLIQIVPAGWFTEPIVEARPEVQADIMAAIDRLFITTLAA